MATAPGNPTIKEGFPPVRFLSLSVRAGEVSANHTKALNWLQMRRQEQRIGHR